MIRHRVPAALAGGALGGVVGLTLGDDLIHWQQALATGAGMIAAGGIAALLPPDARAALVITVLLFLAAAILRDFLAHG